jgi:hypothetical protein
MKSLKRGERLRHDFTEDGDCHVWLIQHNEFEDAGEDVFITIISSERCKCSVRTKFLVQCEHEFVQKGRCFDPRLYSDRWYNLTFYCEEVLDFRDSGAFPSANANHTAGFLAGDDDTDDDDDAVSMDGRIFDSKIEGEADVEQEGDTDNVVAFQPVVAAYDDEDENVAPVAKITYGEVVAQCVDLVKMVQSEQAGLIMVYSIMTRLVDYFRTGDVPSVTIEHVPREEVRTLTTVVPNGANIKRKLSAQETRRKK